VILGGGRREFRPTTTADEDGKPGKRTDNLDLIKTWEADKLARNVTFQYVWNRTQLLNLNPATTEYTFGE
jgi:alkaline phosphatase